MKTLTTLASAFAATLALLGAGQANASTSIGVIYTVTSNTQYATVRFDSNTELMRLDWSNLNNAYQATKKFYAPRERGFIAGITGGTRTTCSIRIEWLGVKSAKTGGNSVTCRY